MDPFGGFRGQSPLQVAESSGMTLVAWWSFRAPWQSLATVDDSSGEDRLAAMGSYYGGPTLVQGTDAMRPRFYDVRRRRNIVPHRESGRASHLVCTDPTLVALCNSPTQYWTAVGVAHATGNGFAVFNWYNATNGHWDIPLWNHSSGSPDYLAWLRSDGTNDIDDIALATVMDGPVSFVVFRLGQWQETWVNGEYLGLVTKPGITCDFNEFRLGQHSMSGTDQEWEELAIFSGTPAGAVTAQERYACVDQIVNRVRAVWSLKGAAISYPPAGTQFLVGVSTTVYGTREAGETVALTWQTGEGSAGTVTYPTSTTWTCDVTATLSDLAETGLVMTSGDWVSTLACSVSSDFEDYFDEQVLIAFEVGRGTTESGGTISEQAQVTGGTGADVLSTTVEPTYNASDSDFGGHASAQGTGTQWLQSTTPGSAVSQSQPVTRVLLCRPMNLIASYLLDGGLTSKRCGLLPAGAGWSVSAGSVVASSIAVDTTQGCLVCAEFGGSGAWALRVRKADGTLDTDSGTGAGSNELQGATWLANSNTSVPVQGKIAAHADVVGQLSAGTLAKLEGYLTGVLGWSAT